MSVHIEGDLAANTIELNRDFVANSNGSIILRGSGNAIRISSNRPSANVSIDVDTGNSFSMDEGSHLPSLRAYLRHGASVAIGRNVRAVALVKLFCHEQSRTSLGDGCLIGDQATFMTSDMHSVLDSETGRRINPPGNIAIAEKVWLGAEVVILKNTRIGSGSIVGIRSVVRGQFPCNCMLLGHPAKAVRSGVTWASELRSFQTGG